MTYEVQFQFGGTDYTVRAETIEDTLSLIQRLHTLTKPADDGWIEWHGGDRPVAADCEVEIGFRERYTARGPAGNIKWEHFGRDSDIMRYRVCA